MLNLLLDSSIWLSFYDVTDDTLDLLGKLHDEVQRGRLEVILPLQIENEVRRNRELVIQRSLKALAGLVVPKAGLPRAVQHYPETEALVAARAEYEKNRDALEVKFREDATARGLPADQATEALFGAATRLASTEDAVRRAKTRTARGNPPGKPGAVGDAIVWESLLEGVARVTTHSPHRARWRPGATGTVRWRLAQLWERLPSWAARAAGDAVARTRRART